MNNKELGNVIKDSNLKPNFGPVLPNDLIPAERYKKLYNEFKAYDLRRTKEINKMISEYNQKIHEYKQKIEELEKENKKLRQKISKYEWKLESNLPTPPPEMV